MEERGGARERESRRKEAPRWGRAGEREQCAEGRAGEREQCAEGRTGGRSSALREEQEQWNRAQDS